MLWLTIAAADCCLYLLNVLYYYHLERWKYTLLHLLECVSNILCCEWKACASFCACFPMESIVFTWLSGLFTICFHSKYDTHFRILHTYTWLSKYIHFLFEGFKTTVDTYWHIHGDNNLMMQYEKIKLVNTPIRISLYCFPV